MSDSTQPLTTAITEAILTAEREALDLGVDAEVAFDHGDHTIAVIMDPEGQRLRIQAPAELLYAVLDRADCGRGVINEVIDRALAEGASAAGFCFFDACVDEADIDAAWTETWLYRPINA